MPGDYDSLEERLLRQREAERLASPYRLPPDVVAPSEPPIRTEPTQLQLEAQLAEEAARRREAERLMRYYQVPPDQIAPRERPLMDRDEMLRMLEMSRRLRDGRADF